MHFLACRKKRKIIFIQIDIVCGNFFLSNKCTIFIFLLFLVAFSFISFWKNDCLRIQFILGCVSKTKVTISIPSEYYNKIRTKRLREQEKYQQGVTFVLDKSKYEHCINLQMLLSKQLNELPRGYLLENDLKCMHLSQPTKFRKFMIVRQNGTMSKN